MEQTNSLLSLTDVLVRPAFNENFIPINEFFVSVRFNIDDGALKIRHMNEMFIKIFLKGTIDSDSTRSSMLDLLILNAPACDIEMVSELPGHFESGLVDMCYLMKRQQVEKNRNNLLNMNREPNLFFLRDSSKELWTTDVSWHHDGWLIFTYPSTGEYSCREGARIIATKGKDT